MIINTVRMEKVLRAIWAYQATNQTGIGRSQLLHKAHGFVDAQELTDIIEELKARRWVETKIRQHSGYLQTVISITEKGRAFLFPTPPDPST